MRLFHCTNSCWRNLLSALQTIHTARRIADAAQATPANWPNNHESIDAKGWAFLLPTVTPEDAEKVSERASAFPLPPEHA